MIGFKGKIICGNISSQKDLALLTDYKFDYIFHQAAISDTRVYDQKIVMETNINSFFSLLKIAKRDNAAMVYASSAATYGSLPSPQIEGCESPENPYGFSKLIMDQIAQDFSKANPNIILVGLRYFNVYGPREIVGPKGGWAAVIGIWRHQSANGEPITIVGDGEQRRDFTHVDDIVDALWRVGFKTEKHEDAWELGTGMNYSVLEVYEMFKAKYGSDKKHLPDESGNYRKTLRENDDSLARLKWTPKDRLKEYIDSL